MNRILRQTALGLGTFGTGCALLALSVNPYLLVLTDTVVGVGMLFAAGSLSVKDLSPKKQEAAGEGPAPGTGGVPGAAEDMPAGLSASLGRLRWSRKPAPGGKGKEEKEAKVKEIDRMLDSTLAGQSKKLISLAEGQGASPKKAAPAGTAAGAEEDLLQEFSEAAIAIPFGDEEADEAAVPGGSAPLADAPPGLQETSGSAPEAGAVQGGAQPDALTLSGEDLGADDLLSALRREALREKKKDDTSLVRDLKGVKVTGKELLEELNSVVRDIRSR